MANNLYVSAGKPLVGGAIYRAPIGTQLPTSALTPLSAAFKSLGYVSEDGLTNENSRSSEDIKEWGGSTVMTTTIDKTDKFKFTLIESLNIEVLKTVFGNENVSGSLESGITVKSNAKELESASYVADILMRDGFIKRIIIPEAKISDIGEIVYKKDAAVGYECTLTAFLDASENTHYERIQKPATIGVLNVTSAAGTSSGKTALSVTPELTEGNSYKYKIGTEAESVVLDDVITTNWTSWNGTSEITAESGKIITVVEVNAENKAKYVGNAEVVSA